MIEGLQKHPKLKDVWIITYKALSKSDKSIGEIAQELSKGRKVFIHQDMSLRVYYISLDNPLQVEFQ